MPIRNPRTTLRHGAPRVVWVPATAPSSPSVSREEPDDLGLAGHRQLAAQRLAVRLDRLDVGIGCPVHGAMCTSPRFCRAMATISLLRACHTCSRVPIANHF